MAAVAYQNDIGTIIEVDTQSDLTDAVTLEIKLKKPSGTILTKDAYIPVGLTAEDGKIAYATITGDLDELGKYYGQAHIEGPDTDHLGNTFNFEVKEPFA